MSEIIEQLRQVIKEELGPVVMRLEKLDKNQNEDVISILKLLSNKIDRIAEGQERQDRILELLSSRSIEQEANINDLRHR